MTAHRAATVSADARNPSDFARPLVTILGRHSTRPPPRPKSSPASAHFFMQERRHLTAELTYTPYARGSPSELMDSGLESSSSHGRRRSAVLLLPRLGSRPASLARTAQ